MKLHHIITFCFLTIFNSIFAKEVRIQFDRVEIQGTSSGLSGKLLAKNFFIDADGDHIVIDEKNGAYDSELILKNQRLYFNSDNFTLSTPIELKGASTLNLTLTSGLYSSTNAQFKLQSSMVSMKDLNLLNFSFQTNPLFLESKNKIQHLFLSTQLNIERVNSDQKMKILDAEHKALIDVDDLSDMELKIENSKLSLKGKVKLLTRISFKANATLRETSEGVLMEIEDVTIASIIPARALVLYLLRSALDKEIIEVSNNKILIKI